MGRVRNRLLRRNGGRLHREAPLPKRAAFAAHVRHPVRRMPLRRAPRRGGAQHRQRRATQTNPQAGQSEGARIAPALRHIWWQKPNSCQTRHHRHAGRATLLRREGKNLRDLARPGRKGLSGPAPVARARAGGATGVQNPGRRGTGHSGGSIAKTTMSQSDTLVPA